MSISTAVLLFASGANAQDIVSYDFEASDGAFSTTAIPPQWEWGPPTSGPAGAHDGDNVWATGLDGDYLVDIEDTLRLPATDLSVASRPVLEFHHWLALGSGDIARVDMFNGKTWTPIDPAYGYDETDSFGPAEDTWTLVSFPLDGLGVDDAAQLRLYFLSDPALVDAGWFIDSVRIYDGDEIPPLAEALFPSEDTQDVSVPLTFEANVADDSAVADVQLWVDAAGVQTSYAMVSAGLQAFTADAGPFDPGTAVSWWVEATDDAGNLGISNEVSFRTFLAAPDDLSVDSPRAVGVVPLSWTAPDSPHPVSHYVVYLDGAAVSDEPTAPSTEVAVTLAQHEVSVAAVFDIDGTLWEGDRCDPIQVAASVPTIDSITPVSAYQGEVVRLEIVGTYLLLVDTDVSLDLGEGVTIESTTVVNADRLQALIAVDEDAQTGTRPLSLVSGGFEVRSSFEVADGADRPQLNGISPTGAEQGASETVRLEASIPFEDIEAIDFGGDIVVESWELTGETTLEVVVTIGPDAERGSRDVEVVSGARFLDGVRFEVRAKGVAVDPGPCSCASSGPPAQAWLVLGLLAIIRRGSRGQARSRRIRE